MNIAFYAIKVNTAFTIWTSAGSEKT